MAQRARKTVSSGSHEPLTTGLPTDSKQQAPGQGNTLTMPFDFEGPKALGLYSSKHQNPMVDPLPTT